MDDKVGEVEEAEALDVEDRTLGQKLLLHVCISAASMISIDFEHMFYSLLTL